PLFLVALRQQEKKLGADHPDTLTTLSNLGTNYRLAGRLDVADRCFEDVLARAARRPGGLPPNLAGIPIALAATYEAARQYAKAEPLHRSSLEQVRKRFGPDDRRTPAAL